MATAKQQPNGSIEITDEALALFRTLMAIREAGDDLEWEEDGGRRREYLTVGGRLHHDHLGLALWVSPVCSDNCHLDAVSGPIRRCLDAAMAQAAAGSPRARPIEDGVSVQSQLEKCTREALTRLRSG